MPYGFLYQLWDCLFGEADNTAHDLQLAEMADARRGALYFLANTDFVPYPQPLSVGSSVLEGLFGKTAMVEDIATLSSALVAKTAGDGFGSAAHHLAYKLEAELSDFFRRVIKRLAAIFGKFSATAGQLLETISGAALSTLACQILLQVPGWHLVQTSSGIYEAGRRAVSGAYAFFSQLWSGYEVELLGGHPAIIANALSRHSLAKATTAAGDTALDITMTTLTATGAAGTAVNIITAVLKKVVAFVEASVQKHFLRKSLSRAADEWKIRESSRCIIHDHQQFSEWFQNVVIPCPILAALTLRSGFLAHPYRFISLIDSDGEYSSADEFSAGSTYIAKLQDIGQSYIREFVTDYQLRFVGRDALTRARLNDIVLGKSYITAPPAQPRRVKEPLSL